MKINKSLLFRIAWTLYKAMEYSTFSQSLKHAWYIVRIVPDIDYMIRMYRNDLYNFARSLTGNVQDAEDLLQSTCLKICDNVHKFKDNGKDHSFKWWAFTIMKNCSIDIHRRKNSIKRQCTVVDIVQDSEDNNVQNIKNIPANTTFNSDRFILNKEIANILNNAVSKFKPKHQKVFELMSQGYKQEEIAEMLNIKSETIRVVIHRIRKELINNKSIKEYVTN